MIICTLKKLMEEYNVSQSQIATATGITRPTLLSLIRNENQSIRYETINQLCKYFEIDMSDLLVFSPVEVKLSEILIEELPFSAYYELEKNEKNYIVSIIYLIDGIEVEFDTNLNVTKKVNSLKLSNKIFFSTIIYEDELAKLKSKNFNTDFIKVYNESINLNSLIKNKLKSKNLNTDFNFKNYKVEFNTMKRNDKSSEDIKIELLELLENDKLRRTFSEKEIQILKDKIKYTDDNK
ncbi:helix-turn-helix domain-containing protein [Staphylococcus chromogenes]|uniref:helix-turn-helix domain-containing protein n=2 Tax=Staphylococcus chromogenes TaxID=46126 RepID=UPI001C3D91FC|nr:helix-turn-helix transcriptional regulator [Staphylococcus chromogenes]MBV5138348.1 helix-turn-helix transcriptional regulator [Staphylococcus chromogenes]